MQHEYDFSQNLKSSYFAKVLVSMKITLARVYKISRIKKILSIGIIVFNFSDAVKVQDFDNVFFLSVATFKLKMSTTFHVWHNFLLVFHNLLNMNYEKQNPYPRQ